MNVAQKLASILTGIKNAHVKDPEVEKVAHKRALICSACVHANPEHPFKKLLPNDLTEMTTALGCDKCSCLIQAKVRSPMERCPVNKW